MSNTPCGARRSPEEMQERDGLARVKIATMQDGTAPIPDGRYVGTGKLKKTSRALTRHLLVKRSKYPWGWYKYRYWTLQSGIMRVYRADGAEYAGERHKLYNIREATCRFETKDMVGIEEPFLPRYEARVRLLLKERAWGPVFLYSKDVSEVKSWERAIRMSKYLLNATDREAMAFVIGRVAGSIMTKGWNALFNYHRELENTRRLIRGLAMRLTKCLGGIRLPQLPQLPINFHSNSQPTSKALFPETSLRLDLSRAWNKARLVYLQNLGRCFGVLGGEPKYPQRKSCAQN